MPQDSLHAEYVEFFPLWQKMDDVLGGEETVKKAGPRYLPMLDEQDTVDYEKYKDRAEFMNATSKTLAMYVGMVFRKDPQAEWPGSETENTDTPFDHFMEDCTLSSVSFDDLSKEVVRKVIAKGRYLTIIDWNDTEQAAYCCNYEAQDVINWKVERIDGKMRLTMLMLKEFDPTYYAATGDPPPDDYEQTLYPQWREFRLIPDGQDNYYVQRTIWRKLNESGAIPKEPDKVYGPVGVLSGTGTTEQVMGSNSNKEDFIAVDNTIPEHAGTPLAAIPAVLHGALGPNYCPVRPPILDLANANLSLYRTAADLDNACHVMGMPTPWTAGFGQNIADDFFLGSSRALVTDNAAAKCGFLALSGGDVQALNDRYEQKKRNLASLGGKMLDDQHSTKAPEAFATIALRQGGETATLLDVTIACSQSLEDVMAWSLFWYTRAAATPEDVAEQVKYELNRQFLEETMDALTMNALASLWTQGLLSFEDVFWQFQKAGVVPPDRTVEEEKALIEEGQSIVMKMLAAHTEPPPGGSASISAKAKGGGIEASTSASQSKSENEGAAQKTKAA